MTRGEWLALPWCERARSLAAAMPCSLRRVYRGHLGLWHLDQLSSEVVEEDRVLSLLPPIEEVSQ